MVSGLVENEIIVSFQKVAIVSYLEVAIYFLLRSSPLFSTLEVAHSFLQSGSSLFPTWIGGSPFFLTRRKLIVS